MGRKKRWRRRRKGRRDGIGTWGLREVDIYASLVRCIVVFVDKRVKFMVYQ